MSKFYDVITVGSATRDALIKSAAFKTGSDNRFVSGRGLAMGLGAKITIDDIYFSTGGAGTNTAVTFARQGFKTAAAVRVGRDVSGEAVIRELAKENIDTVFVQKDPRLPTAYSIILEPRSGERTILAYRGANAALRGVELGGVKSHWFYLSSLSANFNILRAAIEAKKKYGAHIAWNPGGTDLRTGIKKLKPFLKYIDVFILNKEEASALLKISYKKEREIFKKFDKLIDGICVMTMGHEGALVSDGKNLWRAGIFKESKIVDRTGAGDAFGSGFVAGLLRKKVTTSAGITAAAVEEALRVGSANATSKVEDIGAKAGLITRKALTAPRWRNLPIKKQSLL